MPASFMLKWSQTPFLHKKRASMAYIKRHIAETLGKMLRQFKVVLVTGPRQVGKSTLLKNELKDFEYVSLDDMAELELARNDPALFFRNHGLPLVIDEVQYAPELFRQIKLLVDGSDNRGQLCLTGSQTYSLMQNVSESLAGRIGILELQGLSLREKRGIQFYEPFVPDEGYVHRRAAAASTARILAHFFMFISS